MKTWVFKTTDFGTTWTPLATAATEGYAHIIRQDPENPGLLFLGTELGLFISVDGGVRWARFTGGFPDKVAVRDLVIHPRDHDLVIATHGRGIYIVEDLTALRHLTSAVMEQEVAMLPSRPAVMIIPSSIQDFPGDDEFVGTNPAESAAITYWLKKRHLIGDLKLEVYDSQGALVATLPGGKRKGINRVAWPMRLAAPTMPGGNSIIMSGNAFFGPRSPVGTYTVKLIKGNQTLQSRVELVPDPRSTHTAEDRALQNQTVMALYHLLERLAWADAAAVGVRDELRQRAAGLPKGDKLRAPIDKLAGTLDRFHAELVATSEGGWMSGEEQLRERLGAVYGGVNGYDGRPTKSQLDKTKGLAEELDKVAARLTAIEQGELAAINRTLTARQLAPVKLPSFEEWKKK
jgi:hypothetical protein